jgi:hypothetical protein
MIAVGVDTHKENHFAVALDRLGQVLGELVIEASAAGYRELERWAAGLAADGQLAFGIEGTGSYGAGLCEHLLRAGRSVAEVERPRRRDRRTGKSDRIDALAAARKVLAGEGLSIPRAGGVRVALAALLVAYRACVSERTRLLNQLQALHVTAPAALRERIGEGSGKQLERRLAKMRARKDAEVAERAAFAVMRDLAAHSRALAVDATRYEQEIAELVPPKRPPRNRPAPKLGPYRATIDEWLKADQEAPRKQRHTARRIWQRLVEEHGADVSERQVDRYVAAKRREIGEVEAFVPLVSDAGVEAEVDWGQAQVIVRGEPVDVHLFLMRACHSGASFVAAFHSETQ